jgi:hypothetical protein
MRTTEDYAARARGLVPAVFESPLAEPDNSKPENPDPEPENPTPGPGRKITKKKHESKNRAPGRGMPNPQKNPCPRNARSRLEALAERVEREGAAIVAELLAVSIGVECTRFVFELRAELEELSDAGLSARLEPLCDAVTANRPNYLRVISAPEVGATGAAGAEKRKVGA